MRGRQRQHEVIAVKRFQLMRSNKGMEDNSSMRHNKDAALQYNAFIGYFCKIQAKDVHYREIISKLKRSQKFLDASQENCLT